MNGGDPVDDRARDASSSPVRNVVDPSTVPEPLEMPVSLVRGLVLLHLSATSILLVVLVAVMACQRTADLVRSRRAVRRTAAVAYPQEAGASVLDWTIDLRTPAAADGGAVLQRTS